MTKHTDEHKDEYKYIKALNEFKNRIIALEKATQEIFESGIRPDVLYLLIQKASGTHKGKSISIYHIKKILSGIENLQAYVFGEDE